MYAVIKHDQYGMAKLVGHFTNRDEVDLSQGFMVRMTDSIEELEKGLETINRIRLEKLRELSKKAQKTVSFIPNYELENHLLDVSRISEEGYRLIKEFKDFPNDLNLGKLMAIHNKEEWSEYVFCCGSQMETMKHLVKDINVI